MTDNNQPKFTLGEWEQNGLNAVHTKDGRCVALTYINKKEDASLIAAAPAMYAAMQECLDMLEDEYMDACNFVDKLNYQTTDSTKFEKYPPKPPLLTKIQSTLALARGDNQPQG